MKALTNEQLKAIEELSGKVISTRAQLAEALCEALGDEFRWGKGFVNGHSNSIVLFYGDTVIQMATYQFKDPKSVSVKYLGFGDYSYSFDWYGKVTTAVKQREERIGNTIYVKWDRII